MRRSILLFSVLFPLFAAKAQFQMDLEFRPRSEYRDGYTTLSEQNEQGVFLTTQRTRLNISFNDQKITSSFISFQDIRTWGQQGLNTRESTINLYQAWIKLNLADRLTIKIGRQEFEYDDLKILSNSTWRLPARSHDAGLLEWKSTDSTLTVHLAGAVNNEREVLFQDLYEVNGTYKNMGMLWLNKHFKSTELSMLFLDLGQQLADTSINRFRTIGIYGVQKIGKMKLTGSYYIQRGRNQSDLKVAAHMASLNLNIPISTGFSITPGFDLLSGTSAENLQDPSYLETNTFIPLYARRHRYFGVQDMFYAAGFNVPGGLEDYFVKFSYQASKKWRTRLQLHSFSTQESIGDLENGTILNDKHLGYEADFFLDYTPYKSLNIGLGYAHFFASESMRALKQRGSADEIAHFAYLQLNYTPVLFKN
ncbi:MAG: alginate export family protein [Cytophagales bacterium]|nr:alginate export family protein [Cytophagales bacterium]